MTVRRKNRCKKPSINNRRIGCRASRAPVAARVRHCRGKEFEMAVSPRLSLKARYIFPVRSNADSRRRADDRWPANRVGGTKCPGRSRTRFGQRRDCAGAGQRPHASGIQRSRPSAGSSRYAATRLDSARNRQRRTAAGMPVGESAVTRGFAECLASGTTAVGEIATAIGVGRAAAGDSANDDHVSRVDWLNARSSGRGKTAPRPNS